MVEGQSPTVRRRELGAALRRLRTDHGWTAEYVADAIGVSVSKISRMETGSRGASRPDVTRLARLYGLTERATTRLLVLAAEGRLREPLPAPRGVLPTDFITMDPSSFPGLERAAGRIQEFNSGVVPGLLQTDSYMRASVVGSAPDLSGDDVDRVVAIRRDRQDRVLGRRPRPAYDVILDEAAIAREVGGHDVMRAQIRAIVEKMRHGIVSLRVIPFSRGAHPGASSVFILLSKMGEHIPDVVFTEGLSGHAQIDDPSEIDRYRRIWDGLSAVALDEDQSRELLSRHVRSADPTGDERSIGTVKW